ncbi:MAG: hypothetical protein Phog2KO_27000 [Phototrophicaceae bacterium]
MSTHYKFGQDIKQAVKMAEVLEDYVRSEQLYGYAAGLFSTMPSMTVGALLLRLRRLDILREHLKDYQSKQLDTAIDRYMLVRTNWTYHYSEKLHEEAYSRIDAMKAFFYECSDNIRNCIGIYKPEIMRRTIVQELLREMDDLNVGQGAELTSKIEDIDEKLLKVTEKAKFQWADILQSAYDNQEFSWLYRSPPNIP